MKTTKITKITKETKPLHSSKESHSPIHQFTDSHIHPPIYSLYTDGASRGNPGDSGAGIILKDSKGTTLKKIRKYLGRGTNNQAEYNALLLGLNLAKGAGAKKLNVYLDSELVVKQVRGEYRVKNSEIKPLHQNVMKMIQAFDKIDILHIPREINGEADLLANQAIDLKDD